MDRKQFNEAVGKFADFMVNVGQEMFKADGHINPQAFALVYDNTNPEKPFGIGALEGLGPMFRTEAGKSAAAAAIRQAMGHIKPLAFCFMSEAWASTGKMEEGEDLERLEKLKSGEMKPADDPNREEVLLINIETHNTEMHNVFRIHRTDTEAILEPKITGEWNAKGEHYQGKLSDFLQECYVEITEDPTQTKA